MLRNLKKTVIWAIGTIFFIIGIIGLVLPVLQGFLFITIGIVLLTMASPSIRKLLAKHAYRFPKIRIYFIKIETWIKKFLGEF